MDYGHAYGFPLMSESENPLIETTVITTVFMTGCDVESIDGLLRFTAWEQVGQERRIVGRGVMPKSGGHALLTALRRELGQDGRDH